MKTSLSDLHKKRREAGKLTQMNLEIKETVRDNAKYIALLERRSLREWCAEQIASAVEKAGREKGVQLPFEAPSARSGYALAAMAAV